MSRSRSTHPTPRPRGERWRSLRISLLGVALVSALSACGGGADPAQSSPTVLSSAPQAPSTAEETRATEAPTGSADQEQESSEPGETQTAEEGEGPGTWATFTEEPPPLVGEDGLDVDADPRAQAVERFNEEFARAATAGDPNHGPWLATLDPAGHDTLVGNFAEEFGRTYPGPLPFEILAIEDSDAGTSSVQGCMVTDGFSVGAVGEGEGMTGMVVSSIEYSLVEDPGSEGAWLVEAIFAGAYDCSSTSVEARTW